MCSFFPNDSLKSASQSRGKKNNISYEIKLYMSKLDEYIHSIEFCEEIHKKFRLLNDNSILTKNVYDNRSHYYYISKLLKYIDYFLSTGPLTKTEHKLFNIAVDLMYSYYNDKINAIKTQEDISNLFFPAQNTPVYILYFSKKPNFVTCQLTINK